MQDFLLAKWTRIDFSSSPLPEFNMQRYACIIISMLLVVQKICTKSATHTWDPTTSELFVVVLSGDDSSRPDLDSMCDPFPIFSGKLLKVLCISINLET